MKAVIDMLKFGISCRSLDGQRIDPWEVTMPYKKASQAKAVLANTSPSNPKHQHARAEAKKRLKKSTKRRK